MNPRCSNFCTFRISSSGRPPLFCGTACHRDYLNWRRRLANEYAILAAAVDDSDSSTTSGRQLRSQLNQLKWIMTRYPTLTPEN